MSDTAPRRVTEQQASQVLELVRRQCLPYWESCSDQERPTVDLTGGHPVIRWEVGSPSEWALRFPHGGTDEEMGHLAEEFVGYRAACKAAVVEPVVLPAGVSVEAIDSFTVALYPAH